MNATFSANNMKLDIDVPNDLAERLLAVPDVKAFIVQALTSAFDEQVAPSGQIQPFRRSSQASCKDLPAFGMWADRDDMVDPSAYVENIRKPRFQHAD